MDGSSRRRVAAAGTLSDPGPETGPFDAWFVNRQNGRISSKASDAHRKGCAAVNDVLRKIDRHAVRKLLLFPQPGLTDCFGIFHIDDVKLVDRM
ncbi:MAG: hypothetical protein V1929_10230 [bacterium]